MRHLLHTYPAAWLLAFFALTTPISMASGQVTSEWINNGAGLFNDPANWSTPAAPGTSDTARFVAGGTPHVQWDATTGDTETDRLKIDYGQVKLTSIGGSIYSHTVFSADIKNVLELQDLDLISTGSLSVSAGGLLNLLPGSSYTGPLSAGINSKGTILVGPSSSVSSSIIILGQNKSAEGYLTVTGENAILNNTSTINVGVSGGDGVFSVLDGGSATSDQIRVGTNGFGSVGILNVADSGSTLSVTSTLTVGSSPAGSGHLNITAGGAVDSAQAIVGTNAYLGVASVRGTDSTWSNAGSLGIGLNGNLRLIDHGAVTTDTINLNGTFETVYSAAPGTGDYPVTVTGEATLNGNLKLSFGNGFTPNPGDVFYIMSMGSAVGHFLSAELPGIPGLSLGLQYTPNSIVAMVILPGDLNNDGFVGIDDLNTVLQNWNLNAAPADLGSGDLTADGFVGVDDLNTILANWNTGTPPANRLNVPEPACLTLSGLLLLVMTRPRHQPYRAARVNKEDSPTHTTIQQAKPRAQFSALATVVVLIWLCLFSPANTWAVPYASSITQDGDTVNFILNEPADLVTITRDGGSPITIPGAASGSHTFDMTGFGTYSIEVSHSTLSGWVPSPNSDTPMLIFERANGIAVNNNPGSQYFGRFYVSQRANTISLWDREMGDGIYVFNPDATDAFGITDINDTSAARTAGLEFSLSSNSPFRITVGPDDTLYISDWSDINGGIYHTDADVTTGGNLLAGLGGIRPIIGQNHGSIISTPLVSGSLAGGDLVLYTIDEDLEGNTPNTGNHVWRYDIGGADNFAGSGTLALDASTLGTNSDGSPVMLDSNAGIDADITRDPHTGNFIITQPFNSAGTGTLILDPTLTNVLFNSRQFAIDNNIDESFFRQVGSAKVSPDGGTLALRRLSSTTLVPLDVNGVPALDLLDGNLGATTIAAPGGTGTFRIPIAFDLAGNVYSAGNLAERAVIYGPGGDSTAVTKSDGTFIINGLCYGDACGAVIPGDLDGDGFVGIDDLGLVLAEWNQAVPPGNPLADPSGDGFVGIDDLNVVLANWNNGTPPSAPSNIPEPGTWLLSVFGLTLAARRRQPTGSYSENR